MAADSAHESGTFVERMRDAPLLPAGTDVSQTLETLATAAVEAEPRSRRWPVCLRTGRPQIFSPASSRARPISRR